MIFTHNLKINLEEKTRSRELIYSTLLKVQARDDKNLKGGIGMERRERGRGSRE